MLFYAVFLWITAPYGAFYFMTDQLSSIGLAVADLQSGMAHVDQSLGDLRCAFDRFNAGQARIIEGQAGQTETDAAAGPH